MDHELGKNMTVQGISMVKKDILPKTKITM